MADYEIYNECEDITVTTEGDETIIVDSTPVVGVTDYEELTDKPSINGVILRGNKTGAELGLVDAVEGKGLSTNDLTDELLNKLNAAASGGSGSTPLYLSNTNSDVAGYKRLSYTPDAVEVVKTITATNATVYGETYLFDLPIGVDVIAAGQWIFDYWRAISSAAGDSFSRLELFLRHADGTETTTYFVESPSIENTSIEQRTINYALPQFNMLPTDRFGVRMAFRTTRNAATVYSYIVGGQRGHSITVPIPPRHDYLRDKNDNPDFQHLTNSERFEGGLATNNKILSTIKSTSNEAFKNSVTKLSISTGKNLFNKNAKGIIDGKYLSNIGTLFYNALYFISDYIYVEPNTVYTHSNFNMGGAFGCIYTEEGLFICSFNSPSITIPANGRYIRLSGTISTKNTQQVEVGSISTAYEPYIEYLPLSSFNDQLTVFDNKKISKQLSKNLLNPYDNNIIIGKYLQYDGNLGTNANYSISGYIYIQGLQNIAINYSLAGAFIVFYTKDKAYISSSGSGATWAVPSNAYYVRVSGPSLDQTIWQVESGTSFTTFERYSEYTPLLQVQNQAYDRPVDIVLPANLYFVKDNQSCIYYENVLRKNLNDSISLYLSKGINYNRLCAFKFSTPASNQTMTAITIQALKKLNSKSITYNVVDPSANNGKTINVLHIGDSFTDIGTWVKETKTLLNAQGITYNLVGTCGDSTFRAEGLSGGTLANTFLNTSAGVGKRVQVTGVTTLPSTSYPGRTYRDSNGKDWTIRSGKVDGSGNGYLVVTKFGATETDFVNFPASGILTKQGSGEGDEIINYINPTFCYFNPFINPISGQLDINNYITTWGLLTPNIIVIQFTWNDIDVWAIDSSLNNVVANFKTSVDHIHTSLPSAKVVLSIEPFGSVNGNLDFNGKKYSVLRFAELMIAQFENNASYSNWVKIAPSYAFVDLVYGYSTNTVMPCERYALTEQSGGDGTHPSEIGMKQIADCISQIIANII